MEFGKNDDEIAMRLKSKYLLSEEAARDYIELYGRHGEYREYKEGKMKKKILDLLRQNARLTDAQLAAMLGVTEEEAARAVRELETDGIIMGYSAIINEELADETGVTAVIELKVTPMKDMGFDDLAHTIMQYEEVDSVMLMSSGSYDLSVTITGTSLRKVALFVSEQLSVLDGVLSTATHFVLRRYKEKGHVFSEKEADERSMVSP